MSQPQPNFFKQAFNMWERTTAAYFDALVRNSSFLTASGTGLDGVFELKKIADRGMDTWLSMLGIPNRRNQEKTLHLLEQIDGRLDDLEFKLQAQANAPRRP